MGKIVPGPQITPNFTAVALKMWAYGLQIARNDNVWYIMAHDNAEYVHICITLHVISIHVGVR